MMSAVEGEDDILGFQERHSLLLIPCLALKAKLLWNILNPDEDHSLYHHSPYTVPERVPNDRLQRFRSTGMDRNLDILLTGDEIFKPWVAMRVDVLPWFNHHSASRSLTSSISVSTDGDGSVHSGGTEEDAEEVRSDEERSDELATPYLVTKTTHTSTSVQIPPLLNHRNSFQPSSQPLLRFASLIAGSSSSTFTYHQQAQREGFCG